MKISIELAPLNVPLERRLQTLATAFVTILLLPLGIASIPLTIFILVFGYQWMKVSLILYLLFIYYERDVHRTGGRKPWFARLDTLWRYVANYFPIKLIKTVDIDPTRNYIFCVYPHGILGYGSVYALTTNGANRAELFPGLEFRPLTLLTNFHMPFSREYVLSNGCCSSGVESIRYLLSTKPSDPSSTGRGLILLVGGAADSFKSYPGTYRITLKKRRGFIKIALQHGSPLVPVFSFGENDYYDQVENPTVRKFQYFFKKFTGFAPAVFNGRGLFQYSFGVLPKRKPVNVVVGAPIEVPKIDEPTEADINKYHAKFTEKLIDLFETHKKDYVDNYENVSLIIDD